MPGCTKLRLVSAKLNEYGKVGADSTETILKNGGQLTDHKIQ